MALFVSGLKLRNLALQSAVHGRTGNGELNGQSGQCKAV